MRFLKRAATSAVLCLLFLLVYGSCNWLTAARHDVGMFYFQWERHIPFVPLMIIPYMSIDLFFVAAPFLCKREEELRTLARRITFAIFVAGACFLLFPLRFAFDRPTTSGWLGIIFDNFRKMDQPYNLLPSLHIALRTILAVVYARHALGIWRVLSHVWFSLIGFSTLLTYQHHVMDVVAGFVLSAWCFYLFRETPVQLPVLKNVRVGLYYAIGSAIVLAVSLVLGGWGLVLLWPAIALAIVSAAYFGIGPGIYQKENGRLALSTRFVLAPCLLGQYISLLYYKRQCRPWDECCPGVWIGRKLNEREAKEAIDRGVTAVLDLTSEFNEARPFLNTNYCNIPILDLTAPTEMQLRTMAEFISQQAARGIVYVHCKVGYSRSAGAVGAYMIMNGNLSNVKKLVECLTSVRPSIVVRPEITKALKAFENQPAAGIFRL